MEAKFGFSFYMERPYYSTDVYELTMDVSEAELNLLNEQASGNKKSPDGERALEPLSKRLAKEILNHEAYEPDYNLNAVYLPDDDSLEPLSLDAESYLDDFERCEVCGELFEGGLTDLGEMTAICEDCLEENYIQCDCCGNWNDSATEFDGKWYCDDCFEAPDDEDIEDRLAELLANDPEDLSKVEEYKEQAEEYYSGDINEIAFRIAVRQGAKNYVEENIEDIDLNDADGGAYSSYLDETDDSRMEDILMDHGAFRSWEYYDKCRFACETVNGEILVFDSAFQQEVYQEYLQHVGLTERELVRLLQAESDDYESSEDEEPLPDCDSELSFDMDALGASLDGDSISLRDMAGEPAGDTRDLLEELGYQLAFEGDAWKLETIGVYFID